MAVAHNHTILFLNEMGNASDDELKAIMKLIEGQGKGRKNEAERLTWLTPLVSSSNASVIEMLARVKRSFEAPLVDRLMDLPSPNACAHFFEALHGSSDVGAFGVRVEELVRANHGYAGWSFAERFTADLRKDRERLRQAVLADRKLYLDKPIYSSLHRDVTRIHGRFATIFAMGCLAAQYDVIPYSRTEIDEALRICERDHVAFVDRELARLGLPASKSATTSTMKTTFTPKSKLASYLRSTQLIDVRNGFSLQPQAVRRAAGYIGCHRGRVECWIFNNVFEQVVGGKQLGDALKRELRQLGLLFVDRRGASVSYVVKRNIGGKRINVVALKPPNGILNQSRAAGAAGKGGRRTRS